MTSRIFNVGLSYLIFFGCVLIMQIGQCQPCACNIGTQPSERLVDASALSTAVSFPVIFETSINRRKVLSGQTLRGSLKEDLSIGDQLIAPAGSSVLGHVVVASPEHSAQNSFTRFESRFPKAKMVSLIFDEIQTTSGDRLRIVGIVSPQKKEFVTDGHRREVTVRGGGILDNSHRFTYAQTMTVLAADRWNESKEKATARSFSNDIEVGDELYVQAHSPYQ